MKLTDIVNSKGEKLCRELLKAEFSREDKQKASKVINNSGSDNISKYAPRYYILNDEEYAEILLSYSATIKITRKGNNVIYPSANVVMNEMNFQKLLGICFLPLYIYDINDNIVFVDSLDTFIDISKKDGLIDENTANEILSTFTEITEDEYYKID